MQPAPAFSTAHFGCLPISTSSYAKHAHILSPVRPAAPLRMSASVDGVGGVGGVGDGRGPIGRSRLSEFSFAGGDRGIQDDLVREVMWRAAQVAVYDRIDAKIAEFDAGISDILSELFDRREKDIIERNEQMALRAAHLDLARWNSKWREGQRESQKKRQEISAELAIVNKLLLSRQAKKQRGRKGSGKRRTAAVVALPSSPDSTGAAATGPAFTTSKALIGNVPVLPSVATIGLTTYFCLKGFENYVEAHGAQSLAKMSLVSFVALLMLGQSAALQNRIGKRSKDWNL